MNQWKMSHFHLLSALALIGLGTAACEPAAELAEAATVDTEMEAMSPFWIWDDNDYNDYEYYDRDLYDRDLYGLGGRGRGYRYQSDLLRLGRDYYDDDDDNEFVYAESRAYGTGRLRLNVDYDLDRKVETAAVMVRLDVCGLERDEVYFSRVAVNRGKWGGGGDCYLEADIGKGAPYRAVVVDGCARGNFRAIAGPGIDNIGRAAQDIIDYPGDFHFQVDDRDYPFLYSDRAFY